MAVILASVLSSALVQPNFVIVLLPVLVQIYRNDQEQQIRTPCQIKYILSVFFFSLGLGSLCVSFADLGPWSSESCSVAVLLCQAF